MILKQHCCVLTTVRKYLIFKVFKQSIILFKYKDYKVLTFFLKKICIIFSLFVIIMDINCN